MYKSVIDIRKDVSSEGLAALTAMADKAFNNRSGKVHNTSDLPYRLVYEGGKEEHACLEIGMLKLKREIDFLECLNSWKWIEEDPNECCDLLQLFTKRIAR